MKKSTLVHLCLLKHQERWLHHLHSLKDLHHSLSTFEDNQPFRHLRRPKRGESPPLRLSWLADANFLGSFEQSTIQPSCRIKNGQGVSSRFRRCRLRNKIALNSLRPSWMFINSGITHCAVLSVTWSKGALLSKGTLVERIWKMK